MSSDSTIIKCYNHISSYSNLYEREIADDIEDLGDFARYSDIMYGVRSIIYETHQHDTIMSYFLSTMSLEEAIQEYSANFITKKEFVCFSVVRINNAVMIEIFNLTKEIAQIEQDINQHLLEINVVTLLTSQAFAFKLPLDIAMKLI